jgi:hypothetical protein
MIENILTYLLILFLLVIIVIYSSTIESIYPSQMQKIASEPIYRLILLIVIIIISEYNLALALLCAIVFIFMVNDVSLLSNINESFLYGPAVNSCGIYDSKDIKEVGTPFYPLHENERTKPLQQRM